MGKISNKKVEDEYLLELGRAIYIFSYLEFFIRWLITCIDEKGLSAVPQKSTAGKIHLILKSSIKNTPYNISNNDKDELVRICNEFRKLKDLRNDLLHANPGTSPTGEEVLRTAIDFSNKDISWTFERVQNATQQFKKLTFEASALFNGSLINLLSVEGRVI
jgi:hypothetical protein